MTSPNCVHYVSYAARSVFPGGIQFPRHAHKFVRHGLLPHGVGRLCGDDQRGAIFQSGHTPGAGGLPAPKGEIDDIVHGVIPSILEYEIFPILSEEIQVNHA